MAKISLLVPIYNVEAKIERCAVSLFEQTYADLEYIFVDDCSPDRSVAVLEEVAKRYPLRANQIHIVHHEQNQGLAGARNTGYDRATGDYVMIVDSDDYLPVTACQQLLDTLTKANADIASGAFICLWPEGRQQTVLPTKGSKRRVLTNHLCMSLESSALWARLYRRSLFASGLRATVGVNLSEDYMMTNRLMLGARLAVTDEVVYCYDQTDVRDLNRLYPNHIAQMERSVAEVERYYSEHPAGRRYLPAIQMAWLHVMRTAAQSGLAAPTARKHLKICLRPIALLLQCHATHTLGNALYKLVRWVVTRV